MIRAWGLAFRVSIITCSCTGDGAISPFESLLTLSLQEAHLVLEGLWLRA